EGRCAAHLSGAHRRAGPSRLPAVSVSLAGDLAGTGAAAGARSARTADVLRFPAAAVAQAAHHQCHRTMLRGSPPAHPAHGAVRECGQRGENHLCDFSAVQSAVAKPHPRSFYTSSLTSPPSHSASAPSVTVL